MRHNVFGNQSIKHDKWKRGTRENILGHIQWVRMKTKIMPIFSMKLMTWAPYLALTRAKLPFWWRALVRTGLYKSIFEKGIKCWLNVETWIKLLASRLTSLCWVRLFWIVNECPQGTLLIQESWIQLTLMNFSIYLSTVFVIYMSIADLVFISHALLRIDELYNYGDFRGGYFLCLSYNSIKTFLMVESIFLTTLVAYDRWRLSRFKVRTIILL